MRTEKSQLQTTPTERPGGRSEEIGKRVMQTTITLLKENEFSSVTLEQIAREAGVNRSTLYRRWKSLPRLIAWVLMEFQVEQIAYPDTGSLEKDLAEMAVALSTEMAGPLGPMFFNLATREVAKDKEMADALEEFWADRAKRIQVVVKRGIDRGEIRADADTRLMLDQIFGTSYFRLMRTGKPMTKRSATELVRHVIEGFQ
jgi:AcrR family transcriptional regulator